jgi:hypothetical protein
MMVVATVSCYAAIVENGLREQKWILFYPGSPIGYKMPIWARLFASKDLVFHFIQSVVIGSLEVPAAGK